jgi:hypothetical protein
VAGAERRSQAAPRRAALESAVGYARLESIAIGPLTVPVDENAAALVPYAGRRFFNYLSLPTCSRPRQNRAAEGQLAIMGTTAPGLSICAPRPSSACIQASRRTPI